MCCDWSRRNSHLCSIKEEASQAPFAPPFTLTFQFLQVSPSLCWATHRHPVLTLVWFSCALSTVVVSINTFIHRSIYRYCHHPSQRIPLRTTITYIFLFLFSARKPCNESSGCFICYGLVLYFHAMSNLTWSCQDPESFQQFFSYLIPPRRQQHDHCRLERCTRPSFFSVVLIFFYLLFAVTPKKNIFCCSNFIRASD